MILETGFKNPERLGIETQPAIVLDIPKIDVKLLQQFSWTLPWATRFAKLSPRLRFKNIPIPYPEMIPQGRSYRVLYSGVCGSDLKLVHMDMAVSALDDVPEIDGRKMLHQFTLGHEIVVRDENGQIGIIYTPNSCLKYGKLDAINANKYCNPCKVGDHNLCEHRNKGSSRGLALGTGELTEKSEDQGAGYTRQLVVNPSRFVPLPEKFPLNKIPLTVLTDAVSCGFNAEEIAFLKIGVDKNKPILVVGGGMIGFGVALALKSLGYSNLSLLAKYEFQAELAQKLGVRTIPFETRIGGNKELEDGLRVVFECVGTDRSLTDAFRFTQPQGDVIELGLAQDVQLDYYVPGRKELTRHGAFWSALRHYYQAIDAIREFLIPNFELEELITTNFSLHQAKQAFFQRGDVLKNVFNLSS